MIDNPIQVFGGIYAVWVAVGLGIAFGTTDGTEYVSNLMVEQPIPVVVAMAAFWGVVGFAMWAYTPKPTPGFLAGDREDKKVPLLKVIELSPDTRLFRFSLPNEKQPLGLPTGKHIKITCPNPNLDKNVTWNGREDADKGAAQIERKYTPTSSDNDLGHFDLVVKVYAAGTKEEFPDGGKMSQYLGSLAIGDEITMSGPWGLNEYKSAGLLTRGKKEFNVEHIGMIAGGTGITPMLQVIEKIISNPEDKTKVSLLFCNQTEKDILVRDLLEAHQIGHPERFSLRYTLDRPPTEGWEHSTGFVTDEMIKEYLPAPGPNTIVLMCGPPPMIKFACKANLDKLGYAKESQIEF